MARLFKRTYVLVRPDLDASECTDAVNAWDADKNQCYTLHSWDGTADGTLGGANDLADMWGRWNMDPMWTMRNAVECWEANDGKIGGVSITQGWTSSTPPPCFFAMTVLKGEYSDIQKGTLWLDGNFAGQKGMQDKLWPKIKCDAALEVGAEECEYEWKESE
jgi:chitinase